MFELIDFIIVRPIVNILFVIFNFVGDFGFAIILFTILVKLLMWPLVKRQLHQTKLMRKIQPELAQIKKNCNGNRQMESLQTMDLYKRYNIKPFRSILTIFLQLPIYIALFTAIRVIVTPTTQDNLGYRAYPPIQKMERIDYIMNLQRPYLDNPQNNTYDYKPQLFGIIDLSERPGFSSASSITILTFALFAAFLQHYQTKQQRASGKAKKSKKFRELIKQAEEGKEPSQSDLADMVSGQMSIMMPMMMLLIMINLPGALVFYYLLSSLISIIQQHIIFKQTEVEMESSADKAILKELRNIKEAQVIKNKKTGTKITRITAKDSKKSSTHSSRKTSQSSQRSETTKSVAANSGKDKIKEK